MRGQRARDPARLGDVDGLVECVMVINRRLVGIARKGEIAAQGDGYLQSITGTDLRRVSGIRSAMI